MALERAPWGEAAGVAERAHAGGPGGLDAVGAVRDDRAAGGWDAQALRRVQEQIRGWLAAGDLADAEDPAGEALVEPGEPESVANLLVCAARRDAGRNRDGVERRDDPRHRRGLGRRGAAGGGGERPLPPGPPGAAPRPPLPPRP